MAKINFYTQDIPFKISNPRKTSLWIQSAFKKEKKLLKEINYIFCSDEALLKINQEYLNHNTYTDIITFDNSESNEVEGDIYISIDRVKENAEKFNVSFEDELYRVIIHGALHLLGYKDKRTEDKVNMRKKEDAYLSLLK